MKYWLRLLVSFVVFLHPGLGRADDQPTAKHVATTFAGVDYYVAFFKRITPDRLLLGVEVLASKSVPESGTLIGFPVPIPPHANPIDVAGGFYRPRPLSIQSSQMTDDLSQQAYPALSPISLNGLSYRPAAMMGTLHRGQGNLLTIQFQVPPPPPAPPGQPPPKQTVSFMLTNAKGPISGLDLPPPLTPAPAPAPQ